MSAKTSSILSCLRRTFHNFIMYIHIIIIGAIKDPEFHTEYELNFTSTGVCISCTFLDSSTTDCVAVVHQRISQLSSSGLMNIETSHKFNRSGDTAYGCIEGVNLTTNMVGVIGGRQVTALMTSSKSVITLHTSSVHVHIDFSYLLCSFVHRVRVRVISMYIVYR